MTDPTKKGDRGPSPDGGQGRQIKGHGSQFSRKKEAAIAALLTHGGNTEEAARVTGISTQTLRRWLKVPEFDGEYRNARRAVVSQSNARLQQATSAAVTTMLRIMVDPKAPASSRVRAADRVLDRAERAGEHEDFEVRLAALEHALAVIPRSLRESSQGA